MVGSICLVRREATYHRCGGAKDHEETTSQQTSQFLDKPSVGADALGSPGSRLWHSTAKPRYAASERLTCADQYGD
jgi:hypothetical protein